MRRYYPGFFGALFLILLRIAIGWHFLYEGLEKVDAEKAGGKPWSAEGYLRASAGPLAPEFRKMIPDVDSLEALDPATLKARWREDVDLVTAFYGFDETQKQEAQGFLKQAEAKADAWFDDLENAAKVAKYRADVQQVQAEEAASPTLTFHKERLAERRKGLEGTRRELTGPVNGWTDDLQKGLRMEVATDAQRSQGEPERPSTDLDRANFYTKWGLVACGACLILGLFTPLAALGGAALLTLFYLAMPPLPGLPQAPNSEGHYLYVNKNLIEALACLVLASTPSGLWLGLDALLFGWIGRGRRRAEAAELAAAEEAALAGRRR